MSSIREAISSDPAFTRLKSYVIEKTGLDYYSSKDEELALRLGRRLVSSGARDYGAYLRLLLDDGAGEAEMDALVAELTIGETYFFRDSAQFDALRRVVLPDILAKNAHRRSLRIWSAGCATGAEAYSLAILLKRELSAELSGWDVSIVGTDINRGFLSRAMEGVFESWALRDVPEEIKRDCFTASGKRWHLNPEYRAGVSFQYHNLASHPFPSLFNNLAGFDLVLCRNVMIYFDREMSRRLVQRFRASLNDGGWLVVGYAEVAPDLYDGFEMVMKNGSTVHRKAPASGGTPASALPVAVEPVPAREAERARPPVPKGDAEPRRSTPAAAPRARAAAPDALSGLRTLADRGEWEAAMRTCAELLERNAVDPRLHFYAGLLYEQRSLVSKAEEAFRRAIYLDRGYVLAHYGLALCRQKERDLGGARRSLENVVRLVASMEPAAALPDADGLTAGDLHALAKRCLEVVTS
jgi:chemotaxis protein methyltransferase CheR